MFYDDFKNFCREAWFDGLRSLEDKKVKNIKYVMNLTRCIKSLFHKRIFLSI